MVSRIIDTTNLADYDVFLRVKRLPNYRFRGHIATFPDEYARLIGVEASTDPVVDYEPMPFLFDYQRDIVRLAIHKRLFAIFADCGLGKTLMLLEFARHSRSVLPKHKCVLIVSPLMVIPQTIGECARFYGDRLRVEQVHAAQLRDRLASDKGGIVITNYDALADDVHQGNVGALILDESSMLKSHYGVWGRKCLEIGRGLTWKLALTGTPAPNDRIEYANHAVFMEAFPTVNSFLATFFVNRGETGERWELKPHALEPFYRALSHWCIFLNNPKTYGWEFDTSTIPPIHVHVHDVPMTRQQRTVSSEKTGMLFASAAGGITTRTSLAGIAKGWHKGASIDTNKYDYIRSLVESWPDESTIIWCLYNKEQEHLVATFPNAASIDGSTPHDIRQHLVDEFKAGKRRVLISKPKILGFGLNLQRATRQVFSGLQDSYESFYQAVKRSNRFGATKPLNVHIPVTELERPMVENVLRKAGRVQVDSEEQERLFRMWYERENR